MMGIDCWRIDGAEFPYGLLQRPIEPGAGTNALVCSIVVDDLDPTAAAVLQHGGVEALPRSAVPDGCWQGCFQDAEGDTFGVIRLDESAA